MFRGAVAELADAADLKSASRNTVWVRAPPALQSNLRYNPAIMTGKSNTNPDANPNNVEPRPGREFVLPA